MNLPSRLLHWSMQHHLHLYAAIKYNNALQHPEVLARYENSITYSLT